MLVRVLQTFLFVPEEEQRSNSNQHLVCVEVQGAHRTHRNEAAAFAEAHLAALLGLLLRLISAIFAACFVLCGALSCIAASAFCVTTTSLYANWRRHYDMRCMCVVTPPS